MASKTALEHSKRAVGLRINHASVVDGICGLSTTCPRTDQYTHATTERDYQEAAGLPNEDRLPIDDSNGRSRPAQRLWLSTPEWRCRWRGQRQ
eukprot:4119210-Pyramimonas_sp.AAC.1